jgi:hypothetical protein
MIDQCSRFLGEDTPLFHNQSIHSATFSEKTYIIPCSFQFYGLSYFFRNRFPT